MLSDMNHSSFTQREAKLSGAREVSRCWKEVASELRIRMAFGPRSKVRAGCWRKTVNSKDVNKQCVRRCALAPTSRRCRLQGNPALSWQVRNDLDAERRFFALTNSARGFGTRTSACSNEQDILNTRDRRTAIFN
jgi:hypothetical protein